MVRLAAIQNVLFWSVDGETPLDAHGECLGDDWLPTCSRNGLGVGAPNGRVSLSSSRQEPLLVSCSKPTLLSFFNTPLKQLSTTNLPIPDIIDTRLDLRSLVSHSAARTSRKL